ncbi:hypothetical protein [Streptomyces sp. BPTC-684]|uniref:hypothetical protein n=1 Tax=Streptomyces sp. BPTC-684 TaxID=3043734 RepID=UPI0032C23109
MEALFRGALLPKHIREKLFTLPPAGVRMLDGSPARYSMGLQKATVNGVTFWGKTGEWYGYRTRVCSTRDQQARAGRAGALLPGRRVPGSKAVNAVGPGFTATGLNHGTGSQSGEQGAEVIVRLPRVGADGPTGTFQNAVGVLPW